MPNLKTYIDSPLFYNDTVLSASDLNILKNNAELLKNVSMRASPVVGIHRGINITNNNNNIWRGGFQYRVGLTTARFVIWSKEVSGMGSHDIVIYFNDIEVHRYNAAVGGYNVGGYTTVDISINTRGYIDYEIITVRVVPERISGDGDATMGEQFVLDAYTFPWLSVGGGTWLGSPSFGNLTADNLNKLANSLDYLAIRSGQIPYPLQMNVYNWTGYTHPRYPKFRFFKVKAINENKYFNTVIHYQCENLSTVKLTIGSAYWTYGPYNKGDDVWITVSEDIIAAGLSWDTDYFGSFEVVISPGHYEDSYDSRGIYISGRISVGPLTMSNIGAYSTPATPVTNQIGESLSFSQLQTRLNALSTLTSFAYTNITTQSVFNCGYMFRDRYGISSFQNSYYDTTFVASKYREGDVLWVKGQGLTIGWGSVTMELKDKDKINGTMTFKCAFEENLGDSDKVEQSYYYLDQFKGLYPGQQYFIYGNDIHFAAESLR